MTKNTARGIAPPDVRRQFDVRRLVKPRFDKRGRRLKAFETLREAKRELRHRVRLLRLLAGQAEDQQCPFAVHVHEKHTLQIAGLFALCARTRRIERSAAILSFLSRRFVETSALELPPGAVDEGARVQCVELSRWDRVVRVDQRQESQVLELVAV